MADLEMLVLELRWLDFVRIILHREPGNAVAPTARVTDRRSPATDYRLSAPS